MRNALLGLLLLLIISCSREPQQTMEQDCIRQKQALSLQVDSMKLLQMDLEDRIAFLKSTAIATEQNLKHNAEAIRKSLKSQEGLIPKKAVLGGTMRITLIEIIGNNWLLAHYEDGHVQGVSLFKYAAINDSSFNFILLDSAESN